MRIISALRSFFDLDEDIDEFYNKNENHHQQQRSPQPRKKEAAEPPRQNVVNIKSAQKRPKVIVVEPQNYDEVQTIADHLKSRRAVVFKIHHLNKEEAKQLIDFISGAVYIIDGSIQKLGRHTFMCAPANVDVNGVLSDIMEKPL